MNVLPRMVSLNSLIRWQRRAGFGSKGRGGPRRSQSWPAQSANLPAAWSRAENPRIRGILGNEHGFCDSAGFCCGSLWVPGGRRQCIPSVSKEGRQGLSRRVRSRTWIEEVEFEASDDTCTALCLLLCLPLRGTRSGVAPTPAPLFPVDPTSATAEREPLSP